MKYLDSFKLFESRESQTMWGFWLSSFNLNLIGVLNKPTARVLASLLEKELDPQGDDMYGISDKPLKKNGGGIWFDPQEFVIKQGSDTNLSSDAVQLDSKDFFEHPNQFIELDNDNPVYSEWMSVMEAVSKIYPDIKFPEPRWETVYKK